MKRFIMIKQLLFMLIMLSIILLLAFTLNNSGMNEIKRIKIEGCGLLSPDTYMSFAKLNNVDNYKNIDLHVIYDRLIKHPYIEDIDIAMIERGIVEVKIKEKIMEAIFLQSEQQLLLTEHAQLLPMLPKTKNIDLPVITDYKKRKKLKLFGNVKKDKNLMSALKIISTAKFIDKNLYQSISTIDLHQGKTITLDIININYPVLLGKQNEIKKTVYLSKILSQLNGKKINSYLNYLDLRFDNLVYLGFNKNLMIKKEKI